MTIVVENAADQVKAYTEGNGVFPVPPEVAADNAKRAEKPETKEEPKSDPKVEKPEDDDVEGEDGLTPRQKREFTAKMQATIGRKHRQQKEAEELAASQFAERQLALQQVREKDEEIAKLRAQLAPPKTEETGEPKRADFKDDQAYWDAMVDYRVDKKLAAEQAAGRKAQEEAAQKAINDQATAKVAAARELVPDFDEVVSANDTVTPPWMLEAIQSSDLFPELWYHLASAPKELDRLITMTDGFKPGTIQFARAAQRQLVELGKIESKLTPFAKVNRTDAKDEDGETPSRETAKEPSLETGSAPSKPRIAPVIRPLNGGGAQVGKDESEMKGSEVITSWQKKHGVQLTARKRH